MGASVLLKGTSKGVVTDVNGDFRLELNDNDKNGTLSVSFLGFERQDVSIEGRTSFNIVLKEDVLNNLNEVVVTGYGTQRKSDLMGAVASIKS